MCYLQKKVAPPIEKHEKGHGEVSQAAIDDWNKSQGEEDPPPEDDEGFKKAQDAKGAEVDKKVADANKAYDKQTKHGTDQGKYKPGK